MVEGKALLMDADKNLLEPVAHGTYEMPLKFYELDTKIYSDYYLHWHEEMEILLIERGSILVTINRETIRGGAGDFILIGKNTLHSISKDRKDPQVLYFTSLLFHPRLLEGGQDDYCQKNFAGPLMEGRLGFPALISVKDKNYAEIKTVFRKLHAVYKEQAPFYEYRMKGLLFELTAEFLQSGLFRTARKNTNQTAQAIIGAFDYIEQHYAEELGVSALAARAGYSESYFMRAFKRHTGMTAVQFINDCRLRKAALLLRGSALPVEEIAYQTGFESASYFIRRFKEKYKYTPNEYRKQQN